MKKIFTISLSLLLMLSMIVSMPFVSASNKEFTSNTAEWTAESTPETAEVSVHKSEGSFVKDAPIATLRIDTTKINTENVQLSQMIKPYEGFEFQVNDQGYIYSPNCPIKAGYTLYGSFTLRFEDAAILPDGSRAAVQVSFLDVTVIGNLDNGNYTDTLYFAYITGDPSNPLSVCPLSVEKKMHIGMRTDLCISVPDAQGDDTFMFASRSINVSRTGNQKFEQIVDAGRHYAYSESMEPFRGIAAGSDIYLQADSTMAQVQGTVPDSYGYRFVGTNGPKESYQTGFATLVEAKNGLSCRAWTSAGMANIPIEMYLLSANTQFDLKTAAGTGGSISLWADGTAYSQSAAALAGGTADTPLTYSVPREKTVTVVITPDEGYVLDTLTLDDSVEVQPTRTNYRADGETVASYEYDIPMTADRAFSATFKHVHNFSYTEDSEHFCIIAACTVANCPLTDSRIVVQGTVPAHKVFADGLSIEASLSGKDELEAATGGAARAGLTYRTADGSSDFGEVAPGGYGSYSAVITVEDTNSTYTVSSDYSFSKKALDPVLICGDWTYGEAAVQPSLTEESNPEQAQVVYSYKEKGAPDSDYTTDIPVNAGTYTLRAVRQESENYLEGVCYGEITVAQAEPVFTVPTGLQATYGDNLSSVILPGGWEWDDGEQAVGDAGEKSFAATFTPEDTRNFKSMSENVALSVAKKAVTITADNQRSYRGADLAALTYTVDCEMVAGDDLGITLTTNADSSIEGDYEIAVSWTDNPNYDVKAVSGTYTVCALPVYSIEGGDALSWQQGSGIELKFTVHRDTEDSQTFGNFTGLEIDGTAVNTADYIAGEGSLQITLKEALLSALSLGEHTLSVQFQDGTAQGTLTITQAQQEDVKPEPADDVQPEKKEEAQQAAAEENPQQSAQAQTATAEQSAGTSPATGDAGIAFAFAAVLSAGAGLITFRKKKTPQEK